MPAPPHPAEASPRGPRACAVPPGSSRQDWPAHSGTSPPLFPNRTRRHRHRVPCHGLPLRRPSGGATRTSDRCDAGARSDCRAASPIEADTAKSACAATSAAILLAGAPPLVSPLHDARLHSRIGSLPAWCLLARQQQRFEIVDLLVAQRFEDVFRPARAAPLRLRE